MSALERNVDRGPEFPRRKSSTIRDFSGENTAFLLAVGEWKEFISRTPESHQLLSDITRARFDSALRIYIEFISPYYAELQINITSEDIKQLEGIFGHAARTLYGHKAERFSNLVAPFENVGLEPKPPPSPSGSENEIVPRRRSRGTVSGQVQYRGPIPEDFTPRVFDNAETSIKHIALSKPLPEYVMVRKYSISSEVSKETTETDRSTSTLSRAVEYFRIIKRKVWLRRIEP